MEKGNPNRRAPKRILLRSAWQTVNIGDIAHTPGLLRLLEKYLPEVEVYLWASRLDRGVDRLLLERFPRLRIASSDSQTLQQAFRDCDFFLHGSGASLVARKDLALWRQQTGKPYGVYGITLPPKLSTSTVPLPREALAQTIELLNAAEFVFFRDSRSLEFARSLGCCCPVLEFGPDAAFACDLRDEARAEAFLSAQGLESGGFLCCIPRLRYTPYWTMVSEGVPFDEFKHARNEAMKEHDHAPLRQAIAAVVRHTDLKVLICPEDHTQMQVGREMLLDRLPGEVLRRVVWRSDYWLTGEAASTYARSAGLFGNEMHSPILCIGQGTPAMVCRWAEQTSKGWMWEDIGLGEWLFDFDDEAQVARLVPAVLELARDPAAARAKAAAARERVEARQRETMLALARAIA